MRFSERAPAATSLCDSLTKHFVHVRQEPTAWTVLVAWWKLLAYKHTNFKLMRMPGL